MRLKSREKIGSLTIRRYAHPKHGALETLTAKSVVYVKPVWGLLKSAEKSNAPAARDPIDEFRKCKPKRGTRRLSLKNLSWRRPTEEKAS